jgi:uncharacterized protein YkwD
MQLPARLGRASLRAALLALLALAMLPAAPASAKKAPRCAHADDVPTARTLSAARNATMCLVNRERRKHHLRALRTNRRLQASATRYAREMVSREFFAHVTPGGETFTERIRQDTRYLSGALRWEIGENLAWGTGTLATPGQIVAGWMASPPHRANILNAGFREMGIGIALGAPVAGATAASGAATYANQFGRRG